MVKFCDIWLKGLRPTVWEPFSWKPRSYSNSEYHRYFRFCLCFKDKYQAIPLSASRLRQQSHLDFHCYLNLLPKTALPPCIPAIGHPQNTRYYFPYPRRWLVSCGDLGPKYFLWVVFAPGFLLRLRRRGQEVLGRSAFWELLTRRCHHGIPQQLLLHKARKKLKEMILYQSLLLLEIHCSRKWGVSGAKPDKISYITRQINRKFI